MDASPQELWRRDVSGASRRSTPSSHHEYYHSYGFHEYAHVSYDHKGYNKRGYQHETKPHSTQIILQWLKDNYELAEGVCIPRCVIYANYLQFAQSNVMQTVNSASFGKIIRQQFPALTTRRLGTRGQSKYHYYGLAIKDTSVHYNHSYTKASIAAVPAVTKCNTLPKEEFQKKKIFLHQTTQHLTSRGKTTCAMPDFPRLSDLRLHSSANRMKVDTLLVMYRAHCEHVIDALSRPSFEEIQNFLIHFWQGMPTHMCSMLHYDFVINIIGLCDIVLYKTISKSLIPNCFSSLPDSTVQTVTKLMKGLDNWIKIAMNGLPEKLSRIKFKLAKRLLQCLHRSLSLNRLSQGFKEFLQNKHGKDQLAHDWSKRNIDDVFANAFPRNETIHNTILIKINKWFKEFDQILRQANSIEVVTNWLESLVHACIFEYMADKRNEVGEHAKRFLALWKSYEMKVVCEMNISTHSHFGWLQTVCMLCDEYVTHLVDDIISEEIASDMMAGIVNNQVTVLEDDQRTDQCIYSANLETNPTGSSNTNGNDPLNEQPLEGLVQDDGRYQHQYFSQNYFDSRNEHYESSCESFQSPTNVTWHEPSNEPYYSSGTEVNESLNPPCQNFGQPSVTTSRIKYHANRAHQHAISNGSSAGTASQSAEYGYSSYIYEETTSTAFICCPSSSSSSLCYQS